MFAKFDPDRTLEVMESLRLPNNAFIASPVTDYKATWLRDHLFMTYCYYYLGRQYHDKLVAGMHVAFNVLHKQRYKLDRITQPRDPTSGYLIQGELIHTKYEPHSLGEIDGGWGHHSWMRSGCFFTWWQISTLSTLQSLGTEVT